MLCILPVTYITTRVSVDLIHLLMVHCQWAHHVKHRRLTSLSTAMIKRHELFLLIFLYHHFEDLQKHIRFGIASSVTVSKLLCALSFDRSIRDMISLDKNQCHSTHSQEKPLHLSSSSLQGQKFLFATRSNNSMLQTKIGGDKEYAINITR